MLRGKNQLWSAKVIVENKMSHFLWFTVYITIYYTARQFFVLVFFISLSFVRIFIHQANMVDNKQ